MLTDGLAWSVGNCDHIVNHSKLALSPYDILSGAFLLLQTTILYAAPSLRPFIDNSIV